MNRYLTLIGPVSLILALIGFWVNYRQRRTGKILWYCSNQLIFKEAASMIDGLEATYRGTRVDTLSVATLSLVNAGTVPLRASDIAERDPLRIEAREGVQLRRVQLVKYRNGANGFEMQPAVSGDRAAIRFDYAARHEGAYFQVVHTGSCAEDIRCCGSLIGFRLCRSSRDLVGIDAVMPEPRAALYPLCAMAGICIIPVWLAETFLMEPGRFPYFLWVAMVIAFLASVALTLAMFRVARARIRLRTTHWKDAIATD